MAIPDWPADERPREKLLLRGAKTLSDAELLAIFLRTGVKGLSAVDLARQLLHEFGSLGALLNADKNSFCSGHGLGEAKFAQLRAVLEMGQRHLRQQVHRSDALQSPEHTRQYLQSLLGHLPHEEFGCLWLDNRNRVINWEALFRGTIDSASVYPREVVKGALSANAAAVILAHNHPSGAVEASNADRQITDRLKQALELIGVRVLDHIIIGDGRYCSFAEQGWL